MKETVKKIVCCLAVLTVALVMPVVPVKASDEVIYVESGSYEVSVKQGIETNTFNTSGSAGWEWRWLPAYRMEGTSYNVDFSFTVDGFSDLEKSYIANADSVKVDFVFGGGGFGSGKIGVMYMGSHYCDLSTAYAFIRFNFVDQSTATVEFDYLYGLTGFSLSQENATASFNGGFDGRSLQDLELGFKVIVYPNGTEGQPAMISQNIAATITCSYADGSDKVIVVNKEIYDKLGSIQGSIDQGFGQIGDQIGGVQDDINSGFDEVGGKLDNIQSDINTGLDNVTGAINGEGADTSGMDNGMAQLGGQLGDLGDVENELGGLIMDKVEVPDLILTNDQSSALALLVSCLNLAYVDLSNYQVMFAAVLFFGIVGVLLFGRRNL